MGRRLLRMTHQFEGRRLALPRRLATNLSISYIVSTTEDQVSSVSDGLSSTVATGIVDTLNTAIGDSSLNVTVHDIANFETPTVTAVSSTDVATDDSDDLTLKIGLTSFVIICVVGGTVFCCVCVCARVFFFIYVVGARVGHPSQRHRWQKTETRLHRFLRIMLLRRTQRHRWQRTETRLHRFPRIMLLRRTQRDRTDRTLHRSPSQGCTSS